jgi:hypothetical protein
LSDKVKLTKKQIEVLQGARRIATGQSLDLTPRERVREAEISMPTYGKYNAIVVSVANTAKRRTLYGTVNTTSKSHYNLYVVDGEVMLQDFDHYAFGYHDGPIRARYIYGEGHHVEEPISESDPDSIGRDMNKVAHKAQAIAQEMQHLLEEQGEPVPDSEEVRRQELLRESALLGNTIYNFDQIVRVLRDSKREDTLDLCEQAAALQVSVLNERNRLDLEAENIERKKDGKDPLDTEMMTIAGR